MLVLSTGHGVYGFTLDPSVGEFLESHHRIRIPEKGKIYSCNEGNFPYWSEGVRSYVKYAKAADPESGRPYTARYIGSMVADIHRTLLYGGIFMYPADSKGPKKPGGKLRLLYECSPMGYLMEQAGGMASDGRTPILDIQPETDPPAHRLLRGFPRQHAGVARAHRAVRPHLSRGGEAARRRRRRAETRRPARSLGRRASVSAQRIGQNTSVR